MESQNASEIRSSSTFAVYFFFRESLQLRDRSDYAADGLAEGAVFDPDECICESGVMANEINQDAPQSNGKATGGLKPTTAMLLADAIASPGKHPHFVRGLALHFAETAIFLVAVIGAIALGLGITAYFGEHRYVLAYLVAYAGFRFSDLIVRDDVGRQPAA